MDNVTNVRVTNYIPTIYTNPCTVHYNQNGRKKKWHLFSERNGVVIIVYNKTKDVLVLVKQFRPAFYLGTVPAEKRFGPIDTDEYRPSDAITLEFCAGLEDKDVPSIKVAQEEVLEECGYKVDEKHLHKINTIVNMTSLRAHSGTRLTYYYCEVTENMRVSSGGGVEGENVEVLEMKVSDVVSYVSKEKIPSPPHFLYPFYWFLYNKYNR